MSCEKTLSDKAQLILVESLCCSFDVLEPRNVVGYMQEKAELLKFLLEHNDITRLAVEEAVNAHLLSLGTEMFRRYLRSNVFPDHLGSQDIFGYFLKNNMKYIPSVRFDHGETAEEYIKSADGIVDSVVEQLLSYKKPEPVWPSIGHDDSCCCCH